jgi:HEAT repeat protein
MIPAREAADYLLSIAQTEKGSMGSKAIFPATLVDSANVWPAFIRMARNPNLPRQTRTQSVFWLGQAAGDAATKDLKDIVLDKGVDREVREQAVFALSQRPRDEGVPALIAVARTNKDPEIRKKALFWLGQSNDPRAIDLFEELLTRR